MIHLLIITDKQVFSDGSDYFTNGGTPSELNALSRRFKVSFLAPVDYGTEVDKHKYEKIRSNVDVYSLGKVIYKNSLPAIKYFKRVERKTIQICKQTKPDIVIGKCPREIGMFGILAASNCRVPTILHYSYDWFDNLNQKVENHRFPLFAKIYARYITHFRSYLLRKAIERSFIVATVSQEFAAKLTSRFGHFAEEVYSMRNTFSNSEKLLDINSIDSQNSTPNILYVGRMDRNKNIEKLIESALQLKNDGIQFKVELVGDGEDCERLKNLVESYNLEDHVFFRGWVANNKLTSFFIRSRCLVLLSKSEAFGQVIVEAMTSARPVIASNVGGIPELVKHEINGYLVGPDEVSSITKYLKTIILNPCLARKMGIAGRKFVSENYSVESTLDQWQHVVEEAIFKYSKIRPSSKS